MNSPIISKEAVLAALSKVEEPELHQDLVSLNMVQNLQIEDGKVNFDIVLTTPACPLKGKIEAEARQAVLSVPGVKEVNIRFDAYVRNDGHARGLMEIPVKNAVAVASGKGGVGKTTVAVNLAVALAQSGARIGLLDADIYGPNVPRMMGVDRLPPIQGEKIKPAEAYGVKVMSIGFLVPPGKALIWRGPMLHSAIRQFLGDVDWGLLDYLIIDLPPGTGDAQLSLAQSMPLSGGVIVTLPQAVSLEDASRGIQMFEQLNVPILGVIENMSYLQMPDGTVVDVFGRGGGEILAKQHQAPFLGVIPLEPAVRVGGDEGKPIVLSQPESAAGKALRQIAEHLAAQLSIAAFKRQGGVKIEMVE
ncbi:ATPase [Bellilinea caldifistulae]|uniref:Mrp/NBP35 family ATP-binding protein n=1 Tax=Bellilinea caldifistulae TaxID=360411 RepID=UPI00191C8C4E|nr:Mrp/NBP35 family ATP-binding protein [Bellilinea caldifistulae]GAP10666.1 ATPase [Bellilinea caldifistulae]